MVTLPQKANSMRPRHQLASMACAAAHLQLGADAVVLELIVQGSPRARAHPLAAPGPAPRGRNRLNIR